jgi:hypothetical protein
MSEAAGASCRSHPDRRLSKAEEITVKHVLLAIGSLALVALLGVTMVGRSGVDAQTDATPDASGTTAVGGTTGEEKESTRDAWLAALAAKLGVTPEELQTAIEETNDELGVSGLLPGGGHRGAPDGDGPGRGGPGRASIILRNADLADVAAFLGITEDQLETELEDSTFLEVAEAHGKTTEEVRAFLIEQATAAIDERLQEAAEDTSASSDAIEVPPAPATPTATTSA